jgi:succinylglutamic semialdehyde dehydrogenase
VKFVSAAAMLGRLKPVDASRGGVTQRGLVDAAIATADAFGASWQSTEREYRRRLVQQLRQKITQNEQLFVDLITGEIGKPVRFSRAEISRTEAMLDAIERRDFSSRFEESIGSAVVRRRPHGVVAVITPYNNPVYIPLGKIVPAVLHGNSVVWKPAPEANRVATGIAELMVSAGWPAGW